MSKLSYVVVVVGCWLALFPCGAVAAVSAPVGSSAQSHYERPSTTGGPYKTRVVVFVHGIFGDADSTWRYSPTVYWPKLLLGDETFRDSDVYVASYSSPYLGNTMNVDEVVTNLNNRLTNDEVFSKHREVVFVCHSLGGLIVQRLLLMYRDYARQVPFIYFFSTPETGAQIAKLASVFSNDPLLRAMSPGDGNDYLQSLENDWKAAQFHIHRFCAYETKKYKGVLVVDRLSGTRNCDDPPLPINEDHVGIVKPDSVRHDSYVALRNAFRQYPVAINDVPTSDDPNLDKLKALDEIDLGVSKLFVIDKLGQPRHSTPRCVDYSFLSANLSFEFDDKGRVSSEYVVRKRENFKPDVLNKYGFVADGCLGCFSFRDASKEWEDSAPPPIIWFNMPAAGPMIYAEQYYMAGRAGESWKRRVLLVNSSEGLSIPGEAWSEIAAYLLQWGGGGEQDFVKFYNKLSADQKKTFIELRGKIRPNGYILIAGSDEPTDEDSEEIGTTSCGP